MWPDVGASGSFILLWFLLMLMLPKRNWQEIPNRLRAVLSGGRYHVYGPPPSSDGLDSGLRPTLIGVAGEMARLVEMGLALFLFAIWAEGRSARRRLEARRIWDGLGGGAFLSSRIDGALNGEQPPVPAGPGRLSATRT